MLILRNQTNTPIKSYPCYHISKNIRSTRVDLYNNELGHDMVFVYNLLVHRILEDDRHHFKIE